MKAWKSLVESAWDALQQDVENGPMARAWKPVSCDGCRHYLEGGQCNINLEQECRDGGFEAWEGGGKDDGETVPQAGVERRPAD